MKNLDIVIVNDSNEGKFSGCIGFVIDIYKFDGEDTLRYDVQFPFEQDCDNKENTEQNRIAQQMQFGRNDISLIQSH